MCRLAAYSGPEITLQEFIISPAHSLYKQSWEPEEMQEAKVNADGFGFAWYDAQTLPRRYRITQPIWSDVNLPDLANSLRQTLWLAYVRSATAGQGMGPENTQPFLHNNLSFIHNGYVTEFQQLKPRFIESIETQFLSLIKGNTDSEYLFALWLQCLSTSDSFFQSLNVFSTILKPLCNDNPTLVNIIISDGKQLAALKHAIGSEPPSLYYLEANTNTGNSIIIASEPFNETEEWQSLPNDSILIVDKEHKCQIHQLT